MAEEEEEEEEVVMVVVVVSVVQDTDGTSPNNQFTVTMTNPECPLETTKPPYTSGENPTDVFYQLKRNLDYDTEPGPIVCQATFQSNYLPPSDFEFLSVYEIMSNV
ncbi:hypothetical protein E2C01_068354 [Portunus trituberculatus]|uniref:Uncharacterized protein n=1 Tax=Portunus trituberculatus TaxID=210409 RepID=A0A5B7HNM3_PORTR|nr:hypothetical protein [Portunus trituberculatus]